MKQTLESAKASLRRNFIDTPGVLAMGLPVVDGIRVIAVYYDESEPLPEPIITAMQQLVEPFPIKMIPESGPPFAD